MKLEYLKDNVKEMFEDLNNIQNTKNLMQKSIGKNLTKAVKKRVNQIEAFTNFQKLIDAKIDNLESLSGDLNGYYSMSLNQNYRIVFFPNSTDLKPETLIKCEKVKMKGVVDYHGKGKNNWLII